MIAHLRPLSSEKGGHFTGFKDLCLKMAEVGLYLTFTVACVPNSLDSGKAPVGIEDV